MEKQKTSVKAAKHILLVDDDADLVANHRAILEAAGYRVSAAYSAAEGRAALARQEPSLVVLDVMMETFEAGFDLAREIAGTRPQLPVLMLTGVDDHLSAEALAAHIQSTAVTLHHLYTGHPPFADADRIHRYLALLRMEGKAESALQQIL